MPQKIRDFEITDFSGGVRTDKSDDQMERNEFKRIINFDIDEKGRLTRRRGIQQAGQTITGVTLINSASIQLHLTSANSVNEHLVIGQGATPNLYGLRGTYLTVAAAVGDTTLTVADNTGIAAGAIEINGDQIDYTGESGTTGLTGVTGIARAHPAFSLVNQIQTIASSVAADTRLGGYFSGYLNSSALARIFINGRAGSLSYDGTTASAITDADEAGGLFSTNYRNRVYLAGSGVADGVGTRNGQPFRVDFSDVGDAESWDTGNIIEPLDEYGKAVTGLTILNDTLGIFKEDSIFTYNEYELKQRQWGVGAYNHNVIQKIGNLVYTFCPTGIWATNFYSAKKISKPIEKYLKGFNPTYDSTFARLITNTFAGAFENKYYIYIGDITEPETLSDVVLVYDTIKNNWTVHIGYTDFVHFGSFRAFYRERINPGSTSVMCTQVRDAFFAGDNTGKYFRLFEDRYIDNQSTRTNRRGDLTADIFSTTRLEIPAEMETPFYDMGAPGWWKSFGYLELLSERGSFNASYRLDLGGGQLSDWVSLGEFRTTNETKRIVDSQAQEAKGFRISFKVTSNTADTIPILNGLRIVEATAINKPRIYARS